MDELYIPKTHQLYPFFDNALRILEKVRRERKDREAFHVPHFNPDDRTFSVTNGYGLIRIDLSEGAPNIDMPYDAPLCTADIVRDGGGGILRVLFRPCDEDKHEIEIRLETLNKLLSVCNGRVEEWVPVREGATLCGMLARVVREMGDDLYMSHEVVRDFLGVKFKKKLLSETHGTYVEEFCAPRYKTPGDPHPVLFRGRGFDAAIMPCRF